MIKKTFIIAEAGVNHNGSFELAKQLIDVAVSAQADAVKFQTACTEKSISKTAPKADYQNARVVESQYEMSKKLEFTEEQLGLLVSYCQAKKIQFLSTPFDTVSVDKLMKFDLPILKLPSGEITNAPLLLKAARTKKPLILSTGMTTLGEIEFALSVIAFGYLNNKIIKPVFSDFIDAYRSTKGQQLLREKVTLLHCTTEYPTPFIEVNLNAMTTLRNAFHLPVGYSDHTMGIEISIAAAACGAVIIEKHFTLDRKMPGPDHPASLEPSELHAMVSAIRNVDSALGDGFKIPGVSEFKNRIIARKSLVAACQIRQGDIFTEDNLGLKRPGSGISGQYYWEWLGKSALKNYQEDELISE